MAEIIKSEWGDRTVAGATEVFSYMDGGYEWDFFGAWYDPEARIFYWIEDSGCSCNSPMDWVDSTSELSVGSKDELIRAYKEFAKGSHFMSSDDRVTAERDIKQAIKEATK
ncbi:hypothetical protein [Brevibacterium sp. CFH 10365]|uniref:DUF7574 domain-containing protein n=1 Tax=Brevibacterium sp. CFH 10365 TaxID=2585207 RepID=UPI0012667898|nr:hypothetical protein [Brevibacterium sp. CFH 10365]